MRLFILIIALLFSTVAFAHSFKSGTIEIGHPWAMPTAENATIADVYLAFMNMGDKADQLQSASASVAHKVVLWDGKAKVPSIDLPVKRGVALKPDGMAVRLEGLKGGLSAGDKFTLRLTFAEAASVDVTVYVEDHASHN